MIQIKRNEYKQPTEVREFMVQGIIDAFLCASEHFKIFRPYNKNDVATLWLRNDSDTYKPYFFRYISKEPEKYLGKIRGCEMKEAFRIIQEAGYYIFKISISCQLGYIVSEKPFVQEYEFATRVTEFNDFID